jgi:hypothetical protein
VISHGTFLCLNLIARSTERLNTARCISICLKDMRVERLLSTQVDAICFQPPRKVYRAVLEELHDMTYNKVHLATRRPLRRYAGPLQNEIRSKARIFQLKTLDTPMTPGGELTREDGEIPPCNELQWVAHIEKDEHFSEVVIQHVLAGHPASISGCPGTGKSHLLCQLKDRLNEAGVHTQVLAPTNAAARIAGGSTVHAFLTKMSNSRPGFSGVILIDEMSMLILGLVSVLDQLRAGELPDHFIL